MVRLHFVSIQQDIPNYYKMVRLSFVTISQDIPNYYKMDRLHPPRRISLTMTILKSEKGISASSIDRVFSYHFAQLHRFCFYLIKKTILALLILLPNFLFAQYAGPVGAANTTAIHKDSSVFVSWATSCTVVRGPQDISDIGLGYASAGDETMATGVAGTNGIVSLGDGGNATCTFGVYITNGPGWDFAVFENSFNDEFLELAFVEVSSDGINFFRFPAHSLTDTSSQTDSFDSLDATLLNNLAGKYRAMYGTPFDLDELSNIPQLDIDHITHVRVIDVIGNIDPLYATYDTAGRAINDPWPTPFPTGGFDLDAIGVIHSLPLNIDELTSPSFRIFPNPVNGNYVFIESTQTVLNSSNSLQLYDLAGRKMNVELKIGMNDVSNLSDGVYILEMQIEGRREFHKIIRK